VGQNQEKTVPARDFNQAAIRDGFGVYVRRTQHPTQPYRPKHTTSTNVMKQRPTYPPTKATPTQAWPELSGVARKNHGSYVYSPILAKAQHDYARSVFDKAEHILMGAYKGME
jgi:hypothetical protein